MGGLMPLHLFLDTDTLPRSAEWIDRIVAQQGTVHRIAGSGPDRFRAAVEASGFSPDESLGLVVQPGDIPCCRIARIRACGFVPVGETWTGLDEAWTGPQDALRWVQRQSQLETNAWPIATVGGLVFGPDGKGLFVRTAKWSGTWGVPGGKIDYGETHVAAFQREIREETGLTVSDVRLELVLDSIEDPDFHRPRHFLLLNFTARCDNHDVRLNHESLEHGWFDLDQARGLNLNKPTRALVSHLLVQQ
jgi:8-oxo-dGTP pyrophosphatase MutT (NUDIX family)